MTLPTNISAIWPPEVAKHMFSIAVIPRSIMITRQASAAKISPQDAGTT